MCFLAKGRAVSEKQNLPGMPDTVVRANFTNIPKMFSPEAKKCQDIYVLSNETIQTRFIIQNELILKEMGQTPINY